MEAPQPLKKKNHYTHTCRNQDHLEFFKYKLLREDYFCYRLMKHF